MNLAKFWLDFFFLEDSHYSATGYIIVQRTDFVCRYSKSNQFEVQQLFNISIDFVGIQHKNFCWNESNFDFIPFETFCSNAHKRTNGFGQWIFNRNDEIVDILISMLDE